MKRPKDWPKGREGGRDWVGRIAKIPKDILIN